MGPFGVPRMGAGHGGYPGWGREEPGGARVPRIGLSGGIIGGLVGATTFGPFRSLIGGRYLGGTRIYPKIGLLWCP